MLQLEDLLANYPPSSKPGIQSLVTAKQEFLDVGALQSEPAPVPGKTFYNNQRFFLRYMIPNDRLLINWDTGTGKTCALGNLAEYYHNLYLKDPENAPIKRAIVLTPGPGLRDDLRLQIACRCTAGQYLTPKVLEATRLQTQKSNLTREIGKWYTIETYKRFILALEEISDEEIRRRYSRTIIFIDEAHNLNIATKGDKETRKRTLYRQLWRLLHIVEGSKVVLATATPMINETKEIVPLMNLLLPADQQLPENWNYDTITLEQMEPYLRGKVSYVRALDTGIDVIVEGIARPVIINAPEGDIETSIVTWNSVMGDIQSEAYTQAKEVRGGVYDNERQASNFVFPDGSWGGSFPREGKTPEQVENYTASGLGRYVLSPSADLYQATDEFREWLQVRDNPQDEEPHLGRLSCKYESIVRQVQAGTLGTVFIYNDFVFGSGAIVQSLTFEANGFERYTGTEATFQDLTGTTLAHPCSSQAGTRRILLPPHSTEQAYRYAVITSETTPANVAKILDLFSSPENIHGDYLKVLIGSQVAREGLNLSHVTQVHLTTTWWNQSANYQAISRAIRATSHIPLLNEEKRRLQALGEDPSTAIIPVQIFQHAALPDEDNYEDSVDIYMYELADQKDYNIRRMLRILKQVAVDCYLNYERNVRVTDVDYSSRCDYAPCQYQCFDPMPETLDLSTYDVYYIDEILEDISTRLAEIFSKEFTLTRQEIYTRLDAYRNVEVDRALALTISQKRVIYDRYGYLSYLYEDGDRFFLQREFPLLASGQASQALEVYTSDLIATREVSVTDYLALSEVEQQAPIVDQILQLPAGSPELETLIESLNSEGRITLLEEAISSYMTEGPNEALSEIIQYFSNLLYILDEPTEDIEAVTQRLTKKSKRKSKATKPKAVKVKPDSLMSNVEEIPLEEVSQDDENIVFVHTLYNTIFDRVSYNVTTKFKKGEGRLRIFKPSEEVGWRDTKPNENPVYAAVIEEIFDKRLEPWEQYGIYGILLYDGNFRIRDKTTEVTRIQQTTGKDDHRFHKKGRVCTTFDKNDLITIPWKLGMEAPPAKRNQPTDYDELVDYLVRKKILKPDEPLDDWTLERLSYYARWVNSTKSEICSKIQEYFQQTNRLLTVRA